jgi:hypothetical protein
VGLALGLDELEELLEQAEMAWIHKGEPGVDWQQSVPGMVAKAFQAGFVYGAAWGK